MKPSFTYVGYTALVIISNREGPGPTVTGERKPETDLTEIVKFESSSLGKTDCSIKLSSSLSCPQEEDLLT